MHTLCGFANIFLVSLCFCCDLRISLNFRKHVSIPSCFCLNWSSFNGIYKIVGFNAIYKIDGRLFTVAGGHRSEFQIGTIHISQSTQFIQVIANNPIKVDGIYIEAKGPESLVHVELKEVSSIEICNDKFFLVPVPE